MLEVEVWRGIIGGSRVDIDEVILEAIVALWLDVQ